MTTVTLYAEFTARSDAREAVVGLLSAYRRTVLEESGCLAFETFTRDEAPDTFFVFETYRDRAAFEAHLGAPYGAEFNAALAPLIVEPSSALHFVNRLDE